MRVLPNLTIDGEFEALAVPYGHTGAFNDRQHSFLLSHTSIVSPTSLPDLMGEWNTYLSSIYGYTPPSNPDTPAFLAGYSNSFYEVSGTPSLFDSSHVSATTSPGTITDADGLVKWAPHNLLTYSEDFSNGVWTLASSMVLTSASEIDPRGSNTAGLFTSPDANADVYQTLTVIPGHALTTTFYAKRGTVAEAKYRDILYEMPFQIPTDLLFVGRGMGILFGMATSLDPDFDPWEAIRPFAQQMATEEARSDWRSWVGELEKATRVVLSLPGQADRFFSRANRGELTVRTSWAPDDARSVRRVEGAVNRLGWAVIFAALLLAAVAVYVTKGGVALSYTLFALAAVALLVSLTRR